MKSGETITSADIDHTSPFPCHGGNGLRGFTNRFTHSGRYALIGRQGALCGNVVGVSGQFFASEHAVVVTAFPQTDVEWLTYVLGEMRLNRYSESSAQPGLSIAKLLLLDVACPPTKAEQRAIAAVLSDVDELVGSLEALIAKKRDIKQAAMEQLLTGSTRLPGFGGEWETRPLREVAVVTMGQSPPSASYNANGCGLPLVQGKADIVARTTIGRTWTSHPTKRCSSGDILLTVRAPVGSVARAGTDVCLGRGVCGLKPLVEAKFLYYALVLAEGAWEDVEQGSTFSAANSRQVESFPVAIPVDEPEQRAIAAVLSDMDAEIAALEHRLDKTRAIKQGMMQQLLTGAIRLPVPDTAP